MRHCDSSVTQPCWASKIAATPPANALQVPITVAHGDGIGPEIMDSTLRILDAAGAGLDIDTIDIGEKLYLQGES